MADLDDTPTLPTIISRADARAAGLKRYFTGKPCKHGHLAERWTSTKDCLECTQVRCRAYSAKYPDKKIARRAAYYQANREKEISAAKAARSTEEGRRRSKEMCARWYRNNTEAVRQYTASYYATNRATILEKAAAVAATETVKARKKKYRAAHYLANSEKELAKGRAWREANPEKMKSACRSWREANPEAYAAVSRNRRAREREAEGRHTAEDVQRIYDAQNGKCACCRRKVGDTYHVDHIVALSKGGSNWPSNLQVLCQPCNNRKYNKDQIEFMQSLGMLL